MLAIQQVGKELMSNPKPIYFFTGPEYGVKLQYIQLLSEYYKSDCECYDNLSQLLDVFKQKSLIPKTPKVYVVRYDSDFISRLSAELASKILKIKIVGTIVCLYEDDKHEAKLDKYFPDNTVRINLLTDAVATKHLIKSYNLPELYIKEAVRISDNFYQAQLICTSLTYLSSQSLNMLSQQSLEELFGFSTQSDNQKFKQAIASRNYSIAVQMIDAYENDLGLLFYDMLSTYLEIIKCLDKKYSESFVTPYLKLWTFDEAKTFYMITYDQLEKLRNYSSYSPYISLLYICSLLKFKLS